MKEEAVDLGWLIEGVVLWSGIQFVVTNMADKFVQTVDGRN